MVSIYCDGSSSGGSNKPGGWAFVIVRETDGQHEVLAWSYGGDPSTTNNLMEAKAAIQGIKAAIHLGFDGVSETVELVSDSQYVIGVAIGSYQPSKNLDVVAELKKLSAKLRVCFRWIKAHSGHRLNEICDRLAKRGKIEICPETQQKIRDRKRKKNNKAKRKALINAFKNGQQQNPESA